jgi:hypothetical protein
MKAALSPHSGYTIASRNRPKGNIDKTEAMENLCMSISPRVISSAVNKIPNDPEPVCPGSPSFDPEGYQAGLIDTSWLQPNWDFGYPNPLGKYHWR